jgi:hypothetical protein
MSAFVGSCLVRCERSLMAKMSLNLCNYVAAREAGFGPKQTHRSVTVAAAFGSKADTPLAVLRGGY